MVADGRRDARRLVAVVSGEAKAVAMQTRGRGLGVRAREARSGMFAAMDGGDGSRGKRCTAAKGSGGWQEEAMPPDLMARAGQGLSAKQGERA